MNSIRQRICGDLIKSFIEVGLTLEDLSQYIYIGVGVFDLGAFFVMKRNWKHSQNRTLGCVLSHISLIVVMEYSI